MEESGETKENKEEEIVKNLEESGETMENKEEERKSKNDEV